MTLSDLWESVHVQALVNENGGSPLPLSLSIWQHTVWATRILRCVLFGHVWQRSYVDAENGTEDVDCGRCGETLSFRW